MSTETVLQASVTKTAAFTGSSIDVSGVTGDFTLHLRISRLTSTAGTPSARFEFQDSVDAFTTTFVRASQAIEGDIGAGPQNNDIVLSWRKRELGGLSKFGVGSAVCRVVLKEIAATTSPSVTYEAWYTS